MIRPLIKIENLSYTYSNGKRSALKGIDLEIARGETVLLTGKSGCGKSTLAQCLNGLIPHFYKGNLQGRALIDGMDVSVTPVWQLAGRVGTVFQNPESQIFTLTVEEEVAFGPENFGVPSAMMREQVGWALDTVGLGQLRNRSVYALSDGQKQKLAVAACLSSLPEILIFDEPTSNLDPKARSNFIQLIDELKEHYGKTILLIDHRLHGLKDCVDRVIIMEDGEVKLAGSTRLLSDIETIRRFGLREFGLEKDSRPDNQTQEETPESRLEPIIAAHDLSFSYGNGFCLQGISLEVREGETVGIVGGNGSGKTTLVKVLLGLLKPEKGSVIISGVDTRKTRVAETAQIVALVLQNPDHQLFMSTVSEEVGLSSSIPEDVLKETLRDLGISALQERHPHSLSQGEKQRVTIAAALARHPRILILDEPTSGMDGHHLNLMKAKVREMKKQGISVILVSHDAELILALCDRVVLLEDGKSRELTSAEDLLSFWST